MIANNKKVTSDDVARLAGVTKASVSRVLNNKPNISEKTRQRVLEAVQLLNYRPISAARTLTLQKNEMIGLICETEHSISYYGAPFIEGVSIKLSELGQKLAVCSVHAHSQIEDLVDLPMLKTVAVDGLILDVHTLLGDFEALLSKLRIPYVLVNPRLPRLTNTIMPDDVKVARQAVEYLHRHGHQRIGYVPCLKTNHSSQYNRIEGYHRQMNACALKALPLLSLSFNETDTALGTMALPGAQNIDIVRQYLRDYDCSALITYSFNEAIYICSILNVLDIAIPNQISVLSCDFEPSLWFLPVPVTAFHLDRAEMGKMAVEMLHERIVKFGKDIPSQFIEGNLIVGRSVAKLN